MNVIEQIEQDYIRDDIPELRSGDTVRVNVKIQEGEKFRIQAFEGVVIGIHNRGATSTFTVRKISFGYGVERIFPLHSPTIESIQVLRHGQVRRAKLYYLRQRKGKAARIRERRR